MTSSDPSRVLLIDPIGGGGAGTVWRAWDAAGRRFVAAKVVPAGEDDEARIRIDHPHVVTPHARAGRWIIQRLVRGGTLDRLLAEHGALPVDYVAVLLDQLLQALTVVHAAGLVHRDVKPTNILLDPTGTGRPHLLLADFGVTVPVGAHGPPAGTEGYLAPEAAAGAPADPRHDLHAAGVTISELLCGRLPGHARDTPRGPLRALLRDLVGPDPPDQSAEQALVRLRAVGTPTGAPWRSRPHPPDVPDRMPPLPLAWRWAAFRP